MTFLWCLFFFFSVYSSMFFSSFLWSVSKYSWGKKSQYKKMKSSEGKLCLYIALNENILLFYRWSYLILPITAIAVPWFGDVFYFHTKNHSRWKISGHITSRQCLEILYSSWKTFALTFCFSSRLANTVAFAKRSVKPLCSSRIFFWEVVLGHRMLCLEPGFWVNLYTYNINWFCL